MSFSVTFENLEGFSQNLLSLLKSGEGFSIYGIPGCGRGSLLRLIWNSYSNSELLKLQTTGNELIRFIKSPGQSLFMQCKSGNKETAITKLDELRKRLISTKQTILLIHFFESIKNNQSAQEFIHGLSQEYGDKLQIIVSCDLSLLTHAGGYKYCPEACLSSCLLLPGFPQKLITNIISVHINSSTASSVISSIADMVGGEPRFSQIHYSVLE